MTLRSFLIGLLLLVVLVFVISYNDYGYRNSSLTGGNHLPVVVVFVVVVFSFGINPLLRMTFPGLTFTQAEILVIWSMCAAGIGIPSFGLLKYLMPFLVAPYYYSGTGATWDQFLPLIPKWLVPSQDQQSAVVMQYFESIRDTTPGWVVFRMLPHGIWAAWVVPFFTWGLVLMAAYLVMFCMTAILRKQWVEHERLSFPLAQIPLEISKPPQQGRCASDLMHSPLLWVGAAIPIFFWTLHGLHAIYPRCPFILNVNWDLHGLFNAMLGWRGMFLLFFMPIGVAFLLSTEVSLSLWLFFILANVQRITRARLGRDDGFDYDVKQQMGAYFVFAGIALWMMRRHLRDVLRKAFTRDSGVDDSGEALPYRFAVFGFILGNAVIVGWLWAIGCPPLVAILFLTFACVVLMVLSRLVAQSGMLLVQSSLPSGPLSIVQDVIGDKLATPQGLTAITFHQAALYGDTREVMMPSLLNNTKIAEKRIGLRGLFGAMMVAVAVSYAVSFALHVHQSYGMGANLVQEYSVKIYPRSALDSLAKAISSPRGALNFGTANGLGVDDPKEAGGGAAGATSKVGWRGLMHIVIGGAAFLGVHLMRAHFYWWFVHPIGILTAQTYPMQMLWVPVFIGWLCKALAQKYARGPMMAKIKVLFIGLIVGDAASAVLWAVLGLIRGAAIGVSCLPG